MISRDFAERFAEEWIAAWNAHDLPRILSHYEDDFEMPSPPKTCMVRGRRARSLRVRIAGHRPRVGYPAQETNAKANHCSGLNRSSNTPSVRKRMAQDKQRPRVRIVKGECERVATVKFNLCIDPPHFVRAPRKSSHAPREIGVATVSVDHRKSSGWLGYARMVSTVSPDAFGAIVCGRRLCRMATRLKNNR
jgi:hypothetical protein